MITVLLSTAPARSAGTCCVSTSAAISTLCRSPSEGAEAVRYAVRDSAQWLAGCCEGNRLYLDKLSRVAESPDAKQCAGRVVVAETTDNFIPGRT